MLDKRKRYFQLGLAQIPLILGLLLVGLALPAAMRLVSERQETRRGAAVAEPCRVCVGSQCKKIAGPPHCSYSMDECKNNSQCRPKPTAKPTARPTARPTAEPAPTSPPGASDKWVKQSCNTSTGKWRCNWQKSWVGWDTETACKNSFGCDISYTCPNWSSNCKPSGPGETCANYGMANGSGTCPSGKMCCKPWSITPTPKPAGCSHHGGSGSSGWCSGNCPSGSACKATSGTTCACVASTPGKCPLQSCSGTSLGTTRCYSGKLQLCTLQLLGMDGRCTGRYWVDEGNCPAPVPTTSPQCPSGYKCIPASSCDRPTNGNCDLGVAGGNEVCCKISGPINTPVPTNAPILTEECRCQGLSCSNAYACIMTTNRSYGIYCPDKCGAPRPTPASQCRCQGLSCSRGYACMMTTNRGYGIYCPDKCGAPTPRPGRPTTRPTTAPTLPPPPPPPPPPPTSVPPPPECSYQSLQARVQPNAQTDWAKELAIRRGQTVNLGCMHDNSGSLAQNVKLVADGPEYKEWGKSQQDSGAEGRVTGWEPSQGGSYSVYCVSTDSKCGGLSSGNDSAVLTISGCKLCPDGTRIEAHPDYDCDGEVDLEDFSGWYDDFMANSGNLYADFDCSGGIDLEDFSFWYDTFVSE